MSQSIATPTATSTLRGLCVRAWNDPDARSTLIGVMAVVIFHLLLWLIGPRVLRLDHVAMAPRPHSTPREFNIELEPDTFAKQPPKPKDPFKFVETNPEAPENTPDNTTNFAAQNQQVAQEKPTPDGKSDRPATEGKKDFESNQIVSGRLTQPLEHIEAAPPPPTDAPVADQRVTPPKAQQNPLAGTEKIEGENKDGFGASLAKRLENARAVPEKVDGVADAPQFDGPIANRVAINPKQPQPRPQLVRQQQVRPAILAENKFGTTNIGNIAVDARWSEYGAYLQQMIDIVQIKWEQLILKQTAMPARGSTVTVKFILNEDGLISKIVNVDSTASETGSHACVSAITIPAPYRPWTDDMKAILGTQQEMTFTFYYQ